MGINYDSQETITVNQVTFSKKDIYRVVDSFYSKIQDHPNLKIPFASVHNWPEHIDKLTHFWWTRLGGEPYMDVDYNPILKHYQSGFTEALLSQWLELFHSVLNENLNTEQTKLWKLISEKMGSALSMKNKMYTEYIASQK